MLQAVFVAVVRALRETLAHPLDDSDSLILIDARLLDDIFVDAEDELVTELVTVADFDTFALPVGLGDLLGDAVEDVLILLVVDPDTLRVIRAVLEGNELDEVHAVIIELSVPILFDTVITAEGVDRRAVADRVGPRTRAPLAIPPP